MNDRVGSFGAGIPPEIPVEKILDALVYRAQVLAEQPIFLPRLRGHGGDNPGEFLISLNRHRRAADQGELDVDMRNELRGQFVVHFLFFCGF